MSLLPRFWSDLATTDFAHIDPARAVAVLPVAATEQHGPHLPLSVDADLADGIVEITAAAGVRVRIDGGTYLGAEITGYFDSMLVKVTCRGKTRGAALTRARRALREFRIGGVSTNIEFLLSLLSDEEFAAGAVTTGFIAEHPELLVNRLSDARWARLLEFLADVTINREYERPATVIRPREKLVGLELSAPETGSRDRLRDLGPTGFASVLRNPHV